MMNEIICSLRICTDCGEEVERGIIKAIEHDSICKNDAKNVNIESHYICEKQKTLRKSQDKFTPLSDLMNKTEAEEYFRFLSVGIPLGNNCLGYGVEMMEKINEFKTKIIKKYETK